ncbi:MAG: cobyric acid synthase [Deltaproteobacteria bacterium]|jgi:adenosylcobyric acid synthase|nr:cobyric acid synthase [Deltaproteobacteria bacterium]MBW2482012.1 cobyric acid synthase [Deltaproteobacteria bacterium]
MSSKILDKAPCLAVLGTGSDVGKSIITTALCRLFANRGIRVAPYKAQNMSNNSGVTPEGLEMGRAQIVQAEAAKIPPHVDMNPILLKPTSEIGSQVVMLGRVSENTTAVDYHRKKETLFKTAAAALDRLRQNFDLVVMEGAGSCAEVNLMSSDIVNMRMAEYARAPVVLVADIHRGGVFAQLVGTLECLPPAQQDLIKGFIINRFRGDICLFEDGVNWIEEKTGKKVFGVLPWYDHINIEPEDSVVIERPRQKFKPDSGQAAIGVIRLPHISNFNDFDPLSALDGLTVYFLEKTQDLSNFRAVILPGSKNTRFDLNWLHTSGWSKLINAYASRGGHVMGICGGYQIMGHCVHDPDGLEGPPGKTDGLRLLPVETYLKAPKTTTLTRFCRGDISGSGYEIHMGHTSRAGGEPLFGVLERNGSSCEDDDGCFDPDTGNMGTYIHGLFEAPEITAFWLQHIGLEHLPASELDGLEAKNREYELLAEHFEHHIDVKGLVKSVLDIQVQDSEVQGLKKRSIGLFQ